MLFRIIGTLYLLFGFGQIPAAISEKDKYGTIMDAVGGLLIGVLLIYFSKSLGKLFCKGLDDDAP